MTIDTAQEQVTNTIVLAETGNAVTKFTGL